MEFLKTELSGLFIIEHKPVEDDRGFFSRTFCKKEFSSIVFNREFVQFNHSFNQHKGTLRGMHYQSPPFNEAKLIRCVLGSVLDVVIDLRKDSPTFLQHFKQELNSQEMKSIFIPEGFAHGFQTLEDNSALIYHHTEYYTPGADKGLRYDDPKVGINWPLPVAKISGKDLSYDLINTKFQGI
jgi:dTDP-4-dehydrorhamnose 3,5-epimerase